MSLRRLICCSSVGPQVQKSWIIFATNLFKYSKCCHLDGVRNKCQYHVVTRHTSLHLRNYCTMNVPKVSQVLYDPKPDMSEVEVKHLKLEPVYCTTGPYSRRYAVLLSFNGQGFYGMQRNETCRSVEDHLHQAMMQAGLITLEEFLVPQLFQFQRASRTDKGVSAARLVASGDFVCEESELKDRINQYLSDQVHVMAVFRTIKRFNAKTWCDARTYSYTCPTFAFASVTEVTEESYRLSENAVEEVRGLFAKYEGSHNFHNFTSGIQPEARQAIRRVLGIECGEPFEKNGLEWITITIKGRSFLLHQIRKMVGLVISIRRGLASTNFISQALSTDYAFLPIAPGLGLVLENQHFNNYNKIFASDGGPFNPLVWDSEAEVIEEFRQRIIMTPIMEKELREKSMFQWLKTLYSYSFEMHETNRRRDRLSAPLVAFVRDVHHQIAVGNSVCDALVCMSDSDKGKQECDGAVCKVSL